MRSTIWMVGCVLLLAAGCGGGDDDDDVIIDASAPAIDAAAADAVVESSDAGSATLPETLPDPLPSGPVTATYAVYSLGLIQTIKYAEERKPLQVAQLAALDADVLCINEAWFQYTSPLDISQQLSDAYPYAMWTWTHETAWGNDLAIVSKYPLYRGRELRYAANIESNVDRLLISATVVTDDSHFNVLCTHLTSANDPDYLAARQDQLEEIESFIDEQGYDGTPTLLAGDLNCGPEVDGPCADCTVFDDQANYDRLVANWGDPFAEIGPITADDGRACTYCWDVAAPMLLIPPTENEVDVRIDHVVYRDFGSSVPVACDILFGEQVTYTVGGDEVTTQLSDHRGVMCSFAPPDSP